MRGYKLGHVTRGEALRVMRRRCKLTLEQVAAEIGYSKVWVRAMELGHAEAQPLTDFYERSK